jgi:anti-sigma factor ChrR (cupin superfamily)
MLNMDMNIRVIIDSTQLNWQPSPLSGVWRKPLAREDAETGHATSIVRFDTDSRFSEHGHPLGEEILVLDGIFLRSHR